MIRFRYLVNDVAESIAFYTTYLGFKLEQQFGPAIAMLGRDGVTLVVAGPMTSAAKPMPDGSKPEPGGWNRIMISVADIESTVAQLKEHDIQFKNDILEGPGGKQILCIDPSGNVVELFEPAQQ